MFETGIKLLFVELDIHDEESEVLEEGRRRELAVKGRGTARQWRIAKSHCDPPRQSEFELTRLSATQ